jgi:hypothetical protein
MAYKCTARICGLFACMNAYCTIKLVETAACWFVFIICNYSTVVAQTENKRSVIIFPCTGNHATMSRFACRWFDCWMSKLASVSFYRRLNSPKFTGQLAFTVSLCHSHTAVRENRRLMLISTVGIVKTSFFHAIVQDVYIHSRYSCCMKCMHWVFSVI